MSFIDLRFYPSVVCLFVIVVLIQLVFRKYGRISNMLSKLTLLVFSYLVMALYDVRFCLCMTGVIVFTYASALWIEKCKAKGRGGVLTAWTVAALVAVLGVFKYFNFFMATVLGVVGQRWTDLSIILPLGISFYIFSAIGYVLDVSWGRLPAERNVLDMALFLAFFPKQVCGPIVNARDFLPQLKQRRGVSLKGLEAGVQIFVFGFFKKFVLSNHIAVFVDDVYAAPAAYGTATLWLAVFTYFLQLYFDFSGYSDMAVGISKVFGYDLPRNFNLPFIARNISDFWDRWHISLTSWLNEYLFNPIALKFKRSMSKWPKEYRKKFKALPTYAAMLITFLVSGIWHGVGFTFIVWGALHGILSILHGIYAGWMKKHHSTFIQKKGGFVIVLDILANYFVLNIIQVFFRADTLGQAVYILRRMFSVRVGIEQPNTWAFIVAAVLLAATLAACRRSHSQGGSRVSGYYPIMDLSTVRGLTGFFIFCGFAISLAYFGESYFIYGKF